MPSLNVEPRELLHGLHSDMGGDPPDSAASRTLAVPLYPSTSFIGSSSAACTSLGTSSVVEPGAVPPILTGLLDLNQSSIVLMPLALVKAQTPESGVGTPSQPNSLPSNLAALFPSTCWSTRGPIQLPITVPSRGA